MAEVATPGRLEGADNRQRGADCAFPGKCNPRQALTQNPDHFWEASNEDRPWEPMIFYIPGMKPISPETLRHEPLVHENGARRIVGLTLAMRSARPGRSEAAEVLKGVKGIELIEGDEPLAEVRVSGGGDSVIDLSPESPVRLVMTAE